MEIAGLVLLALVMVRGVVVLLSRAAGRARADPRLDPGAGRRATDEVWTVLAYTAPGSPTGVQRAVVTHLDLPTRAVSAFDSVTYLQADRSGGVVVVHGTSGRVLFIGGATFGPTADGGTTGTWEIRRWATRDGVACAADVVAAMVAVRTGIADAVRAVGGTADTQVLSAALRDRR